MSFRKWSVLAAAGLTLIAGVAAAGLRTGDADVPSGKASQLAANQAAVPLGSYYVGELGADAQAAVRDPKNRDMWIGMVRGADGMLHVDMVVAEVPSPQEQARNAARGGAGGDR